MYETVLFQVQARGSHQSGALEKCGQCGAQFSHYSSLNRHTKQAHEGVKIGVCKFCKKEFNKSEFTKEVVEVAHQRLDKIWDWGKVFNVYKPFQFI